MPTLPDSPVAPSHPPREDSGPCAESRPTVIRVEVSWQSTVFDVITVEPGRRHKVGLPIGGTLAIDARDASEVFVSCNEDAPAPLSWTERTEIGPFSFEVSETVRSEKKRAEKSYEGTFSNAFLLAAAVQTCFISALLLHPTGLDTEPGGGLALQDLSRYLKAPEGDAPRVGPAVFVAMGRPAEDAERVVAAVEAKGRRTGVRSRRVRPASLEDALAALSRAVNNGTQHGKLKDTVGDLALSAASSPQLGAGLGGMLRPRTTATPTGAGSGEVGLGSLQIKSTIRERIKRLKKNADAMESKSKKRRKLSKPIPVATVDVPRGEVTLDPVVHDHIARTIGKFRNSVRYCYETWGLPTNPTSTGRLVLELTLMPDGTVSSPHADIDQRTLSLVGDCVEKQSSNWFLGDGLVEKPTRMAFPYVLQPSSGDDPMR